MKKKWPYSLVKSTSAYCNPLFALSTMATSTSMQALSKELSWIRGTVRSRWVKGRKLETFLTACCSFLIDDDRVRVRGDLNARLYAPLGGYCGVQLFFYLGEEGGELAGRIQSKTRNGHFHSPVVSIPIGRKSQSSHHDAGCHKGTPPYFCSHPSSMPNCSRRRSLLCVTGDDFSNQKFPKNWTETKL